MENESPDRNSPEYWDLEGDYDIEEPEEEDDSPEPECECFYIDVDLVDNRDCPVHGGVR